MWGFKNGPGPAKMGACLVMAAGLARSPTFVGQRFGSPSLCVGGWATTTTSCPHRPHAIFFWGAGGRKGVPLGGGAWPPRSESRGWPGGGEVEGKGGEAAFVHFMQQFTTHTNQRTQTQAPAPHPRCRRARDRPPLPSMASSTSTKVRCCFPSSAARPLFVPCEPTFLPLPMPNQPQQRRA